MNNPLAILRVFDHHLEHSTELTLYGRSALALGFPNPRPDYKISQDVDAILPLDQLEILRNDESFWLALKRCNEELEPQGLYMTHLFSEVDVIIRPDWSTRRVAIPLDFKNLTLFRPAIVDLLLTKMMRYDPQDLMDIRFLLEQRPISNMGLQEAFAAARVPNVLELRDIFHRLQPNVLAMADEIASGTDVS